MIKRSDTKVRKLLIGDRMSTSEKYRALVIGRQDWWSLIKYEMVILFCSWIPGVIGLFLRAKLYPMLLGHVGRGVVFGTNVMLRHAHKIDIGDDVVIDDNCLLDAKGAANKGISLGSRVYVGRNSILSCKDGDIRLDDGVNIGFNCEIFSSSSVKVGRDTLIGAYTYLIGGGNYALDEEQDSFAEQDGMNSKGGVEIGPGAWIGADVKIFDGVQIGSESVIGAGAVVKDDIPPRSIAAGIPAKLMRTRSNALTNKAEL